MSELTGDWHRFHPLTPLVKGWQPIAALLVIGGQRGLPRQSLAYAFGVVVVTAIVVGASFYLNWRVSRYRIEGADLVLETGLLNKRSRRVPLARLQAVDLVRPLLARFLSLTELRLEVAGGNDSNASLAYLDDRTAGRVRNDLLMLAAGLRDDVERPRVGEPTVETPDAPEAVIATTPLARLLASIAFAGPGPFVLVLVAGAVVVGVVTGEVATALGLLGPIVFGFGGQLWSTFAKLYGSVLADSPDGLRIRRGLLETRSQTVPPGRVQGVVVAEPVAFRVFGWVRLDATVAGYGNGGSGGASLLPVAPTDLTTPVIARVLPGVAWADAPFSPVPARARWRAPIEGSRLGVGFGDDGGERVVVTRRGRFSQRRDIVPLARVQSVRLRQGPVQRRLRLATVNIDTSSGPVKAVALHRDENEARVLLDTLVVEGRQARAASRPDRWMQQETAAIALLAADPTGSPPADPMGEPAGSER